MWSNQQNKGTLLGKYSSNFLVVFWGNLRQKKSHSEINWPLIQLHIHMMFPTLNYPTVSHPIG